MAEYDAYSDEFHGQIVPTAHRQFRRGNYRAANPQSGTRPKTFSQRGSNPQLDRQPGNQPRPFSQRGSNPQLDRQPGNQPRPFSQRGSNPQLNRQPGNQPRPFSQRGSNPQLNRQPRPLSQRGNNQPATFYRDRGGKSSGLGGRKRSECCLVDEHVEYKHKEDTAERDTATSGSKRRENRRKREHPMGYKALESMLTLYPDQVVLKLQTEHSGYDLLIGNDDICYDKMCLLMQVLCHASKSQVSRENLNTLLVKTFNTKFINHLIKFSMVIGYQREGDHEKTSKYFTDLSAVLHTYAHIMPTRAVDHLLPLIDSSVLICQRLTFPEIVRQNEETKAFLENEKLIVEKQHNKQGKPNTERWMEKLPPPNNFRDLPVIPTAEDISDIDDPYLRENITQGGYKDVDHYLDVQFRLLREDFVRPLRLGIQEFRLDTHSKNLDIRIYKDVKVVGSDIKNGDVVHYVEIPFNKKIKIENSKRLLYGNLLCFSTDNFKTLILGSVAERNMEDLKKGRLGVKFEDDISNQKKLWIMAESRAYFMAYKHVLKALQGITTDSFPFQEFIINVTQEKIYPSYLTPQTTYDLRVFEHSKMMKKSETFNQLFRSKCNQDPEIMWSQNPRLQTVRVMGDLELWPSVGDLGLDESQHRALKSALTSKLAIIQGPPGTGKTFIGLKIAQTLLHNSDFWKLNGHSPILVVCFTNHALDQFLEGIAKFTKSIVRVGSRTKSDVISDFQIRTLINAVKRRRQMPEDVYELNQTRHQDALAAEKEVRKWKSALEETENPQGILQKHVFLAEEVITDNVARQIQNISLHSWLMDPSVFREEKENGETILDNPRAPTETQEEDDNENWRDAEELMADEEDERMIDMEDNYSTQKQTTPRWILDYEVHIKSLEKEFMCLSSKDLGEIDVNLQTRYYQEVELLTNRLNILRHGLQTVTRNSSTDLEKMETRLNIKTLSFKDRWLLYKIWLKRMLEKFKKKTEIAEKEFQRCSKALEEIRCQEMLHVMRHAAVVGMTTTGAAQNTTVLQALEPSIVIIEEAAEILEAHVITSLSRRCKHLIMIGDHQQLQPSATVYELATKYKLEISLFERMIKNGLPYETLDYQHRMRPEISSLLVPSIYPHLKNHSSVDEYPCIKGVTASLFFINHTHHEDKGISDDNNSRQNTFEGELIMALCRHLILQGYKSDNITILTPYSGQFFLLRKLQRKHHVCQGVPICIVDNFQGEENDIILLSLVRSNEKGQVGFLRKENRVCVALSRAKHGLYITGNMSQLTAATRGENLWTKINEDLIRNKAIGSALTLRCENHPEHLTSVSSGDDLLEKCPEGGCLKACSTLLPSCNHRCPKICHMTEQDHTNVKCPQPCPKMCERNHYCQQRCWEACKPCTVLIAKTLPCGHTHEVRCHDYKKNNLPCPTVVKRQLPHCNHEVEMQCHRDPVTFPCPIPCDIRLECGHQCPRKCHTTIDPDHLEFKCEQPCTRVPEGCSKAHRCQKPCWEKCELCMEYVKKITQCGHRHTTYCHIKKEDIICKQDCRKILPCQHPCPKKCSEECGGCLVKVKKIVPDCRHEIQVECSQPPLKSRCEKRCIVTLPCSHPCRALCREVCTEKCQELVRTTNVCPKGHAIYLPCHLQHQSGKHTWTFCSEPCSEMLDCEHPCGGQCGSCLHGRLHIACAKKCERSLPCGHVCKAACSAECPPCTDSCPLKCKHSRCKKKCGEPCTDCQEKCLRRCIHQTCTKLCSQKCSVPPCKEPCEKKLRCGHPCVGYCGDPCPHLCRSCDKDTLTEILFGSEDEEDARFVLLEDCRHVIEADGLENWLSNDVGEISMKKCPRCQSPIYNNRRFQGLILKSYENIRQLKYKYYTEEPKIQQQDIEQILSDVSMSGFHEEVRQIKKSIRQDPQNVASRKIKYLSDAEWVLLKFLASVLQRLSELLKQHPDLYDPLKSEAEFILTRAMSQKLRISRQMMEEITCELQRIVVLPAYWKVLERFLQTKHHYLGRIRNELANCFHPCRKFDSQTEEKVRGLLKESEKFIGGLGISEEERLQIIGAVGLKQGHWYKCPNGHIYCIGECGGAMEESKCPECGEKIGGRNHALHGRNRHAGEMDGSHFAAWSDQANMANYVFDH
ncbi:NFX1-type zinc finger-containing protein 1-like [Penaeus chinensis]|uniref:NFX1-type zinc finger-containing protein 1-like n=1 Tax=Penaeus chinensis TaxID=139456 RepID=UPI001FB77F4A|nr:NFX1-type zinc finger-containing protein 1-like [Penaeus chinensis]XP_047485352.1 NFX1-type zinc finger-containing protein 1-like [Penaeus chinensis]